MFPESKHRDTAPYWLGSRGNYMFGMQSMVFLEWICRLCKSDKTGKALTDFFDELAKIEPRYFTELPGDCSKAKFFPSTVRGLSANRLLLCMMFDLLRNGLGHMYEQTKVPLSGGDFGISLCGAQTYEWFATTTKHRAKYHLSYLLDGSELVLNVHPAILMLDFKVAFEKAKLDDPPGKLTSEVWPKAEPADTTYKFTAKKLQAAFRKGKHPKFKKAKPKK